MAVIHSRLLSFVNDASNIPKNCMRLSFEFLKHDENGGILNTFLTNKEVLMPGRRAIAVVLEKLRQSY